MLQITQWLRFRRVIRFRRKLVRMFAREPEQMTLMVELMQQRPGTRAVGAQAHHHEAEQQQGDDRSLEAAH